MNFAGVEFVKALVMIGTGAVPAGDHGCLIRRHECGLVTDFSLPEALIAQRPVYPRAAARLLQVRGDAGGRTSPTSPRACAMATCWCSTTARSSPAA